MMVTLVRNTTIHSYVLPEKVKGRYWVRETDDEGRLVPFIGIEGIEGQWTLKGNRQVAVLGEDGASIKEAALETHKIYALQPRGAQQTAFLYTEPVTADRQQFQKYLLQGQSALSIGRSLDNDIVFNSQLISARHARITYGGGSNWLVEDLASSNGIFVQGTRVNQQAGRAGQVVFIMGLKIILGNGFIALNNPDGHVSLHGAPLLPLARQEIQPVDEDDDYSPEPQACFYRSPRFKRDLEEKTIQLDSPPAGDQGNDNPVALTIGPSVTMGMASMSTALFSVNNALANGNINQAIPSIVMCSSMLLGSIMWPSVSRAYDKRRRGKNEVKRQEMYRLYLDEIAVQIMEECAREEEILRENYPTLEECEQRIVEMQRSLWERSPGQNDFLNLRLGTGTVPMYAQINYSQKGFSVFSDQLEKELYTLSERPKMLENVPIVLSLFKEYISGIIGPRPQVLDFVRGLVMQLVTHYSYDEVKLVFLYDPLEQLEFDFARWLPHVWDDARSIRFMAASENEVKEVSAYIERDLAARLQNESNYNLNPHDNYYIIFALDKALASRAEVLRQLFNAAENPNISLVACYDELHFLPKECATVVEVDKESCRVYNRDDITTAATSFTPDIFSPPDFCLDMSGFLANILLDNAENNYQLPNMITFLEMFEVGKIEHLNPLTRWKENDPTRTLEAPIGVDTLGNLFMLDLHEKFHGPHGLVAGMTGSGKSEFIITYILSLAVNYHPHELAFILIDYKGGGMAKAFETLPHTAGIITNLDGSAVKRSLVSIESELKRRQAIFGETSKTTGVSNIDIYKYQKLYREGSVSEPLQHLFIISDEFAELKSQQPEFMAQLISAARIGRSLGVHLILATQKPSGVVDDQIWSNSRFRVCLKVQERADSMDMLKREDAAAITHTGRFYLQVGYNELFEMGQSAWAGAPYQPSDKVVVEKDDSIQVVDRIGRVVRSLKPQKKSGGDNLPKQLDAITEYLEAIAREENIKIRPLWLPPIPALITLAGLEAEYEGLDAEPFVLAPLVGQYDDPARQRQCAFTVPLSKEGNVVLYGAAGGGKTTFLTTMVASLIQHHSPDEVQFYLLDFASETLRAFSQAPHVGDVVLSHETEKVVNLFRMLGDELARRKKLFSDFGGDYQSYIHNSGQTLPNLVVAINNYATFSELYEDLGDELYSLTREGTKYGVYFVLATASTSTLRFRMQQNFNLVYVLQMNDESEYSAILGKTGGLLPAKYKGRGLYKAEEVFEFQTAHVCEGAVMEHCRALSREKRDAWQGAAASRVPVLPEQMNLQFAADYILSPAGLKLPVGVLQSTLEVVQYPLDSAYLHLVLADGKEYLDFFSTLSRLAAAHLEADLMVIDPLRECDAAEGPRAETAANPKACADAVGRLFDMVLQRNNEIKTAWANGEEPAQYPRQIVFINSLATLKSVLDKQLEEKLGLLLEKGSKDFNVFILLGCPGKELTAMQYDSWFKQNASQTDGIWVGSGLGSQYQLKLNRTTREMQEELPDNFGYLVTRGRAQRMKLLSEKAPEEE